ncbi:DUF6073 family protein [Primorskyibacter sp. 2E107]|uniref:DUF6073 family protein n=1 Tax=Primorskyibacter sp. 2E107 TaxID=3403458 RepID=UPI003AF6D4A9
MIFKDMKLPCAALVGAGLSLALASQAGAEGPGPVYDEAAQAAIQDLLAEIPNMNIEALPALPIQSFTLPEAGVDVLRAKVTETYTIEGIGTETVELAGWIAVLHGDPVSIIEGEAVRWENFQVGTEFVGLDLRADSALFGPIQVTLNPDATSIGRVGMWPDSAVPSTFLQQVGLSEDDIDDLTRPPGECAPIPDSTSGERTTQGGCCYAPLAVKVSMTDLDLEMVSERPVLMYSYVETIPPVGYVASTSLAPRPLVADGRAVGTLQSAAVTFREIVHHMPLDGQLLDGRFDVFVASN